MLHQNARLNNYSKWFVYACVPYCAALRVLRRRRAAHVQLACVTTCAARSLARCQTPLGALLLSCGWSFFFFQGLQRACALAAAAAAAGGWRWRVANRKSWRETRGSDLGRRRRRRRWRASSVRREPSRRRRERFAARFFFSSLALARSFVSRCALARRVCGACGGCDADPVCVRACVRR